jgi:large subunit ribosomal protein L29
MKATEVKAMSDEQLALALKDTEKHLFQLRFQSATDRLETPSEIRKAKQDIARVRTEQRARELKSLEQMPDDKLTSALAALTKGEPVPGARPFVGRRQPTRAIHRLTRIQGARTVATKGKK